jgi:hypothetical protein
MLRKLTDWMAGTLRNPAAWAAFACVAFYWLSYASLGAIFGKEDGNTFLQIAVSSVGLVLVTVLLVRWWGNARAAFRAGALQPYQQQQLGIFTVFFMLDGQRVLSLLLTYFNRPDWLVESGVAGFIVFGIVCGVALHLYATRSEHGPGLKIWVQATVVIALLTVIATGALAFIFGR